MEDNLLRVLYLAIILAALGGWALVEYRSRLGEFARSLLAWALILLGLMAGYGIYLDSARELRPVMAVTGTSVEIPRAPDGHYYLQVTINGTKLTVLADTGATSIVLSPKDAEALGIDPASLTYLGSANTANGVVRTARVKLPLVQMGEFTDQDVTAYVNQSDMDGSLMGMAYLGLFDIKISGDRMILSR
jgi:aspartyl protease family protein